MTAALAPYDPTRAVRLVDNLLVRQQADALRYVPHDRWTPAMIEASHLMDDDTANLDRILAQGAVTEADVPWLRRNAERLVDDGWIDEAPVGAVILRTAPVELMETFFAEEYAASRETVTAVVGRTDLPAAMYRRVLLGALDQGMLLRGTEIEGRWAEPLVRALTKADLWDTSVPAATRGRLVRELPTDACRFAAIVPADALDAFIDQLLPGEPGTDAFLDAVDRLTYLEEERLLQTASNRALSSAGAAKLAAWSPEARRVVARRRDALGAVIDQGSALRALGRSLLKHAIAPHLAVDPSRHRSLMDLVGSGEPLSPEEWAAALGSADPALRARIAVHPDAPVRVDVPALAVRRVRDVAAVTDEMAFPAAPRSWIDLPTRPDLFAVGDPAFTLESETVTVLDEPLSVRVIASASQLEANADYMGNCTEGFRESIEAGTTRLIQLVTAKGKIRYNVELTREEDGTWHLGEVNSRHNRGADPAVSEAVAPLTGVLTNVTRWFAPAPAPTGPPAAIGLTN